MAPADRLVAGRELRHLALVERHVVGQLARLLQRRLIRVVGRVQRAHLLRPVLLLPVAPDQLDRGQVDQEEEHEECPRQEPGAPHLGGCSIACWLAGPPLSSCLLGVRALARESSLALALDVARDYLKFMSSSLNSLRSGSLGDHQLGRLARRRATQNNSVREARKSRARHFY